MARRRKIQLVRPYQDEQEFVSAEAWTIRKRSMLLIDAPDIAIDTDVRLDLSLESGEKIIRAEGRIIDKVAPKGRRPGGLKMRFQRMAPDTQEFINQLLSQSSSTQPIDSGPAASSSPIAAPPPEAPPEAAQPADDADAEPARLDPAPQTRKSSDSGLHQRVVGPVEPPPNREELLDKLRARQRRRLESDPPSAHPRTGEDAG